jgi:hypothetical protein
VGERRILIDMSEAKNSIQGFVGYRMRLKNRRVQIGHKPDEDGVCLIWKKLHEGKPKETVVTLTQEAAEATLTLLMEVLRERPSAGITHIQGQPNTPDSGA